MKIVNAIGNLIYAIVIATVVLFALGNAFSVDKSPWGFRLFVVTSGSMEPEIKTGSVVAVVPVKNYQEKDIITFLASGNSLQKDSKSIVTHRIVAVKNDEGKVSYQTKGDANKSADSQIVFSDQVLGKVVYSLPYLGYPINFAKTQMGLILFIVIPATLIIYGEIQNIRKEIERILKRKHQDGNEKKIYYQGFTKLVVKATLLLLFLSSQYIRQTAAVMKNLELSKHNTLKTDTLDLGIRNDLDNFSPAFGLTPGTTSLRNLFIQELGTSSFKYNQFYEFVSGDSDLCNNLQIEAWYLWYEGGGTLQMAQKYSGALSSFHLNIDGSDAEMKIPNANTYVINSDYGENEHWFFYQVSLPYDTPTSLNNKTCRFNLVSQAWQEDKSDTFSGFWDEEKVSSQITSGEWMQAGNLIPGPTGINVAGLTQGPQLFTFITDDRQTVGFSLRGISEYDSLTYTITYDSDSGRKGIGPSLIIISGEDIVSRAGLVLGICSESECVYDTGVANIHIRILLSKAGEPDTILEDNIE